MAVSVSLKEIIDAVEPLADGWTARLNPKNGKIVGYTQEEEMMLDDSDRPEWFVEPAKDIREAIESEDYVDLPGMHDFHEWRVMRDFAEGQEARIADRLLDALHGKRAHRRFKDTVANLGREQQWFAYRDEALRNMVIGFLEANDIPYVDNVTESR